MKPFPLILAALLSGCVESELDKAARVYAEAELAQWTTNGFSDVSIGYSRLKILDGEFGGSVAHVCPQSGYVWGIAPESPENGRQAWNCRMSIIWPASTGLPYQEFVDVRILYDESTRTWSARPL